MSTMVAKKGEEEFNDEELFKFNQYLIYLFNTIFFVAGAMIFSIGIYITFDQDMIKVLGELSMQYYYKGTAVIIAGSSLVVLNSFVGCCAAFAGHRGILIIYQVITGVTFIMLLGGSAFLLKNGLENTNLYPHIQETLQGRINFYQINIEDRRGVDRVQEMVGCCGGNGGSDYIDIHLPVPNTCRDHVTGNQFGDACAAVVSWYMELRTGWLCGLALCLCFCQLLALITSIYTRLYIIKLDKASKIRNSY